MVWDVVYNGILYSLITGVAKTNPMLHRALRLPYPKLGQATDGEGSARRD